MRLRILLARCRCSPGRTGTASCESMVCVIGSTGNDMDTAALIDAWISGNELLLSLAIGTGTGSKDLYRIGVDHRRS